MRETIYVCDRCKETTPSSKICQAKIDVGVLSIEASHRHFVLLDLCEECAEIVVKEIEDYKE